MVSPTVQCLCANAIEFHRARNLDEAKTLYQQVLALDPSQPDALHGLGLLAHERGENDVAIELIRRAIQVFPNVASYHGNLGMVLAMTGQLSPAIDALRQAIRLQPDQPALHNNLGTALHQAGRLDESSAAYRRALSLQDDFPDALNNLATLGERLRQVGKLEAAIDAFGLYCHHRPNDAIALNSLGVALYRTGRLDEAADSLRKSIAIRNDVPAAHVNLANVLRELGDIDQALASYRRAVDLDNDVTADSNLIYSLYFHPGWDGPAILREHQRWNRQHAQPLRNQIRPHESTRDLHRRLRIGYVSPDFREHVLSLHFVPLFQNHGHRDFEVFCYSSVTRPDSITAQLKGFADTWRDVASLDDEQLAQTIRDDRIDILVDLTMHMGGGRPLLFARKPAPIQVACDAYPGTTGLTAMDYRLTDPFIDPPGENDDLYTERSIRLPDSFWVYDPLTDTPPVNQLPSLNNRFVTFGVLHTFTKVNDPILALWAAVLNATPESRLLMLAAHGSVRQRVLSKLEENGVDRSRIDFVGRMPRAKYLEVYHRLDIHLDTLPYCAHATALDSLWMGVPMVTRVGKTLVGRAGWCYLNNLQLTELAAHTDQQFVQIARDLASDLPRLQELRSTLRPRMERSPLMDGRKFAAAVTTVFREIWQHWCSSPHGPL